MLLRKNTNTAMHATPKTRATGIQRGEVTHHQDQLIVPVSFRTRKIKNNTIPKLIPVDFVSFSMLFD